MANLVRKICVYTNALNMASKGFSSTESKRWAKKEYKIKHRKSEFTKSEIKEALSKGYFPEQYKQVKLINTDNLDLISPKEYAYLSPINGEYSKWISDIVSTYVIFKPYRKVSLACYYQLYKRYQETKIVSLSDEYKGETYDDIFALLDEKGKLRVRVTNSNKNKLISSVNGKYFYGKKELSKEEMIKSLDSFANKGIVLTEDINDHKDFIGAKLHLTVFNEYGDNPCIGDAYFTFNGSDSITTNENDKEDLFNSGSYNSKYDKDVNAEADNYEESTEFDKGSNKMNRIYAKVDMITGKIEEGFKVVDGRIEKTSINFNTNKPIPEVLSCAKEITDTIDSLCRFAPQLEFFKVEILITDDGFKILRMVNNPSYPCTVLFSKETNAYLKRKVELKKKANSKLSGRIKIIMDKIRLTIRRKYARTFFPKGMLPYLTIRIFNDMKKDFFTNKDTTLKEKIWAIKHGFISYRLHQYGITEENHTNFISDFEYKWLRHINCKYKYWMEDKITVKYVCSEYNNCFPEYYYHIILKNGAHKIIPLMDCPKDYGATIDDIFNLVREKGSLALKPDQGSHGDGFYKFSYDGENYYLNHQIAQPEDVKKILQDVNNQYIVTEYINMHHEIKRIYDGAVNTIRMIVFKKDGVNPVIGNAYMRFGSKRTGAVDNMGAGGMYAAIDVETGKFHNAKIIEANEIKPCLYHPDTNVKIEGYLPNWEKVKADVLNVARSIPQLEYFGFDLALTEDGLKFPEINRFPDYPAIEKYSPATIDYLLYKLEMKKKMYRYDIDRGKQLIKLPKR